MGASVFPSSSSACRFRPRYSSSCATPSRVRRCSRSRSPAAPSSRTRRSASASSTRSSSRTRSSRAPRNTRGGSPGCRRARSRSRSGRCAIPPSAARGATPASSTPTRSRCGPRMRRRRISAATSTERSGGSENYNGGLSLEDTLLPDDLNYEVQNAVFDVQRYLLDQIPPLTASDAIETLMAQPPELLMKQIDTWAVEQGRLQDATRSDFLFHALRKVYVIGTLKLIDRSSLDQYLDRVVALAMQTCSNDERQILQTNLSAMRNSLTLTSSANMVNVSRDSGAAAAARPGTAPGLGVK